MIVFELLHALYLTNYDNFCEIITNESFSSYKILANLFIYINYFSSLG